MPKIGQEEGNNIQSWTFVHFEEDMPLYDCMLLLKPHVDRERLADLVSRIGKHVYTRKGVLTDIKSFGTIQLGYGIRKRDGRHYEVGTFTPEISFINLYVCIEFMFYILCLNIFL